jgi:hypothetical protein
MHATADTSSQIATDKPPRRRRFIPLSVRLFAAILGLVLMVTAWFVGIRSWRIHTIEQAGGDIIFGTPHAWWRRPFPFNPWWPNGLGEVESINLMQNNRVTSAVMRSVNGLSELSELRLSYSPITDADLARLTELVNLKTLWLSGPGIGDAGLSSLPRMRKLEDLSGRLA